MNFGDVKAATKARIVILISGSGSNMAAIADALKEQKVDAEIVAVISNKEEVAGLQKAQDRDLHTEVLNHKNFASRQAYDMALIELINRFQADLIVLAGFMRVLSPAFVQYFPDRILNIHPSLLPKYQGLHTHQRVLDENDKEHGVTVHFVNENLDDGPNVIQALIDIEDDDTVASLERKIRAQEHIIYPIAVKWFVEGRLKYKGSRALIDGQELPKSGLRI